MTTLTQADLDRVAGKSSRKAAEILGVGKSTVNKYRKLAEANGGTLPLGFQEPEGSTSKASIETRQNGSLIVDTQGPVPQSKGDVDAAMIKRGFSPDEYDFTYRFSEWEALSSLGTVTMYAARAGATPKRSVAHAAALDVTELLDQISNWEFTPIIKDEFASADQVVGFADPQIGKVDENGNSTDTANQVLQSFAYATEIAKEERPTEILFADLGDGLENFWNTPKQRETNDLDLTEQVRVLRRLQAEGLRMLRPYCQRLTHASVPSNHGMVRIGFQQEASTASNDWGLEVSHQLQDVFQAAGSDIEFIRTKGKHDLSVGHRLANGTGIGMSHGDQSAQHQIGTWWMKQAFGWENPLRNVDLFLYGHHHNQALEEVYQGRWAIGCASSDRGSAWFTSKTGRSASSGITTFLTADRKFWRLELV